MALSATSFLQILIANHLRSDQGSPERKTKKMWFVQRLTKAQGCNMIWTFPINDLNSGDMEGVAASGQGPASLATSSMT